MPKKQRVTPGLGIDPTPARPSARPRDAFVQFTGNAASQPLRELASSLSRFGEQGSRFAGERQKAQQEAQSEEGRQAFLQALEEQKDTAKAIASLEMRPQQSKWFRWGVQAAAGKTDALRARDFFYANYGEELENAMTLEEYDELAAKALDEYRGDEGTTEAFDNGFFPGYMAIMENGRYEFARGLDGKLGKQRLTDYEETNLAEMTIWLRNGQDSEELAAVITGQLDAMRLGENPLLYPGMKEIVVQNLKSVSDSLEDLSIIELAKQIKIGQDINGQRISLWDEFKGGSDGLLQAEEEQIDRRASRRNDAVGEEARAEQIALKAVQSEVAAFIMGEEGAGRTEGLNNLIDKAYGISTNAGMNIQATIESRERFNDFTDDRTYTNIQTRIWNGDASIQEILNQRSSLTRADTRTLLSELRTFEAAQDGDTTVTTLLKDSRVTRFVTDLGLKFGEGLIEFTSDEGERLSAARSQFVREVALNTDYLRTLSEPDMLKWLTDRANTAAMAHKSGLQLGFEDEGRGIEGTPIPRPSTPTRQPDLEAAFSNVYDMDVSAWGQASEGTYRFGDAAPPGFEPFALKWNAMRPDAPVGSQQFLYEWLAYRQKREGTFEGTAEPITVEAN